MSNEPRMNPAVKAKWLTALRSGDYEQGNGALRHGDTYCCLGVLTDIWATEQDVKWFMGTTDPSSVWHVPDGLLRSESAVAPRRVMAWSDLLTSTGTVVLGTTVDEYGVTFDFVVTLSDLNDAGSTFEQIADIIEYAL